MLMNVKKIYHRFGKISANKNPARNATTFFFTWHWPSHGQIEIDPVRSFFPCSHNVYKLYPTPISHQRAGMQRPKISMFYDPSTLLLSRFIHARRFFEYPTSAIWPLYVRTSRSTSSTSVIHLRSIHFLCHSLSIHPLCEQTNAAFYSLTLLVRQQSHRIVLSSHCSPLSQDLSFNSRKYNANKKY